MSGFVVTWTEAALEQLDDIWVKSSDRHVLNAAVKGLDALLAAEPFSCETAHFLRKAFVLPLCVIFCADAEKRTVEVASIRCITGE